MPSSFLRMAHFSLLVPQLLLNFSLLISFGFISGSDDRRVLLWSIKEALISGKKLAPKQMEGEHRSNVFCLAVSPDNSKVISGGNDHLAIIHDTNM